MSEKITIAISVKNWKQLLKLKMDKKTIRTHDNAITYLFSLLGRGK